MIIQTMQFLIFVKNAANCNKESVQVKYGKPIFRLVKVLYKKGFLQSYKIIFLKHQQIKTKKILIYLRYFYNKPVLRCVQIISSPCQVICLRYKEIVKLNETKNMLLFSTSKGILTSSECKLKGVGGTLLILC
jgi:ribosomal protein S8